MRFLCLLAALVLVGATPERRDLPTRAAQASGEPWRYHVSSRLVDATTRIDAQGAAVVIHHCNGIVCSGTVLDAATGTLSLTSFNDAPIKQSAGADPAQVTLRAIVSYAFTSKEFRDAGGTVVPLDAQRLAVTAPHGSRLVAQLDPDSGLLLTVTLGPSVFYRSEDVRRVGPLMLPFREVGGVGTSIVYSERRVDPDPLRTPSGPPATFDSRLAPLGLQVGTLPRFDCRVDGRATRCLLDSGAAGMAMSLDLADRLHKNLVGQIALEGLGRVSTGVVRVERLELGAMQLGPALFAVLPDVGSLGADVVVGSDVLAASVVRVDPKKRTLAFAPPGTQPQGRIVALGFAGLVPTVPIRLGSEDADLVLDTGDDASIDLTQAFVDAHPGLFVAKQRRAVVGVGGRGMQLIGRVGQVEFASYALSDVPAAVTPAANAGAARVGSAFLAHFALDLDYTQSRMSVRPVR